MALHHCQKWPAPASSTQSAVLTPLAMPSAPGSCRLMDRWRIKVWENALPPLLGAAASWKLIGGRAGEQREGPSVSLRDAG